MVELKTSEEQSKTRRREKVGKLFERLSLRKPETKAQKLLFAMANSVKYQLSSPEEVGFDLISTKEGFWKKTNNFEGVHITRITEASDQPGADWDARRLKFRINKRDIKDGQMAVLFLPSEFECTDNEATVKINERVERQRGEKDYTNRLEAALGEVRDLYKPEQWKPSEMYAIVSLRIGDSLYSTNVYLDNNSVKENREVELLMIGKLFTVINGSTFPNLMRKNEETVAFTSPINRNEFKGAKAKIGQLIYLSRDEESEYLRFNEKYGKLLITRKVSRDEVT